MRDDLDKVIIERPRGGPRSHVPRHPKPLARAFVDEDSWSHDPLPKRLQRTRWLRDLLSPLERWLRAQVGRPWDAVYSEVVRTAGRDSTSGRHLIEHAERMVQRNCWRVGRGVLTFEWGRPREVHGLYVDPNCGLLRWRPHPPRDRLRREGASPRVEIRIDATHGYVAIDGCWFAVTLADAPLNEHERLMLPVDPRLRLWGRRVTHKRQLARAELRRLGLANTNTDGAARRGN